ncbi:hypothetical protein ACRRTK_018425 [Alexandromys fortis]
MSSYLCRSTSPGNIPSPFCCLSCLLAIMLSKLVSRWLWAKSEIAVLKRRVAEDFGMRGICSLGNLQEVTQAVVEAVVLQSCLEKELSSHSINAAW